MILWLEISVDLKKVEKEKKSNEKSEILPSKVDKKKKRGTESCILIGWNLLIKNKGDFRGTLGG